MRTRCNRWGSELAAAATAILSLTCSAEASPRAITLGQTFPIAEPDTLEEIEQAARTRDWQTWMRRQPSDYGAFTATTLPVATTDASRLFDPTYALPFDIRDERGRVLHPKGTRVNVYEKLKIPGRYIVIAPLPSHYEWLDRVAKPSGADKVLLANGNVLETRQSTGRTLYLLDQRFVERFGLQAVPAIVAQEGHRLRVREYALAP